MLFRPPLRRPALHNVFSIFHESRREDSLRISWIFQLLSISSHPDALFDRRFVDESRDTLFNPFFPGFERNKFIEITLLAPFSDILFISMLYANSSYTFLLFFSISRSIFTSSLIYREHPDNLYWNNTIPVGEIIKSQLRKERERERRKVWKIWSPWNRVSSKSSITLHR